MQVNMAHYLGHSAGHYAGHYAGHAALQDIMLVIKQVNIQASIQVILQVIIHCIMQFSDLKLSGTEHWLNLEKTAVIGHVEYLLGSTARTDVSIQCTCRLGPVLPNQFLLLYIVYILFSITWNITECSKLA